MKNLNTRTKMLLAIAGIVIVVVIAGILFMGPADDLFGSTIIHISPENPTIHQQDVKSMYINSVYNCDWSTSNSAIANFYHYDPYNLPHAYGTNTVADTKLVEVYGVSVGQATITAKCAIFTRHTTVTVY